MNYKYHPSPLTRLRAMLAKNPQLTLDEARRRDASYRHLSEDHLGVLFSQAIDANAIAEAAPRH